MVVAANEGSACFALEEDFTSGRLRNSVLSSFKVFLILSSSIQVKALSLACTFAILSSSSSCFSATSSCSFFFSMDFSANNSATFGLSCAWAEEDERIDKRDLCDLRDTCVCCEPERLSERQSN